MSERPEGLTPPQTPAAPVLPEVDSPSPEDLLHEVPSVDEIIDHAKPAEDVVAEQPSREDLADS